MKSHNSSISKRELAFTGPSLVRSSTDILTNTYYSDREDLNVKRMHERVKDAYLVFRALCKLSMKPIPNPDGYSILFLNSKTNVKDQMI